MPVKKPIPQEPFITAATEMLKGKSIRQVMKDYQLPERDARWLSRNQDLTANEFREMVIDRLQIIMSGILEKIYEKLDQIPAGQLAVTFGILSDKMQLFVTEIESHAPEKESGYNVNGKMLTPLEIREILLAKNASGIKRNSGNSSMSGNSRPPDIIDCTPLEDSN